MQKIKSLLTLATFLISTSTMAYEEPSYKTVFQSEDIEVRFYNERKVVQTKASGPIRRFKRLFDYIDGANENSEKISMTSPVTELNSDEGMIMQFYLPSRFAENKAPLPTNSDVEIFTIDAGYYGVISFSGRSSARNFEKHAEILKQELEKNNIKIIGPFIKATFDPPFTKASLRRNESMFLVNWEKEKYDE